MAAELTLQIAQWLRASRGRFAAAALNHKLPLAQMEQVPVAEPYGNGMQSGTELRSVSPFAHASAFGLPPVYAATTTPFIDGRGESIAQELVEQFGDGIRYLCTYSPMLIEKELEHPELVSDLVPPSQDPADPMAAWSSWGAIFYALALLRQALLEYLALLPSLGQEDADAAARLSQELVGFAGSTESTYVTRVPLAGLDIQDERLDLPGCTLRRLDREELGYLFSRRFTSTYAAAASRVASDLPGTFSIETVLNERIALEIRTTVAKSSYPATGTFGCQKLILALHLLGIRFSGAGFGALLQEPRFLRVSGQSMHPILMPKVPVGNLHVVTSDELQAALKIAETIPDGALGSPTTPIDISLRRVGQAMSRQDASEALVDYTVALEALFLGSSEMGGRRFALNGAVYLGEARAERMRLYQQLSDIYSARTVVVHGVNPKEPRVQRAHKEMVLRRDNAAEIARRALGKALSNGWPTDRTFLTALLDDPAL